MNMFLNELYSKDALTWNGAVSHSTSGDAVLDYFAKAGSFRGRTFQEVAADMGSIFGQDELLALKAVLYNRMVTRKVNTFSGQTEKIQKGQGNKDEFIKSIAWLEQNRPELLYKNLHLIPLVGCWKDLWYDSANTGFYYYVNPEKVYKLVSSAMQLPEHRGLVAKFLPKIRSKRNTKNDRHRRLNKWAKGLANYLGWSNDEYRRFKSDPENTAHNFQRVMCDNRWGDLNFNEIPGKALFNLISRKGRDKQNPLQRHGIEGEYVKFLEKQPVAKFTGYPYELYRAASLDRNSAQTMTYNKQFDGLIEKAKKDGSSLLNKGVLCALDTSGSMGVSIQDNLRAIDVCIGLGIYFSSLIEGPFKDNVVMFDSKSKMLKLNGKFCDKVDQIKKHATAWGDTNFQSVIDEIVRVRQDNPEIPVEDYPQVLLVCSDMQFNPVRSYRGFYGQYNDSENKTNYEEAMKKLHSVGLPEMTIIWWHVNGRYTKDVPNKMDDPGVVMISGFDGAIVSNLLGMDEIVDEKTGEKRKPTPYEQMVNALNQEVLNQVKV